MPTWLIGVRPEKTCLRSMRLTSDHEGRAKFTTLDPFRVQSVIQLLKIGSDAKIEDLCVARFHLIDGRYIILRI